MSGKGNDSDELTASTNAIKDATEEWHNDNANSPSLSKGKCACPIKRNKQFLIYFCLSTHFQLTLCSSFIIRFKYRNLHRFN